MLNLNFKKIDVLVDKEVSKGNFARIFVEPLELGYSLTIGTALRRVMLSSMPGTSVVGFRMEGVTHELMTMPGTATDAVELISNLKKLKFDLEEDVLEKVIFKAKKPGIYKADSLKLPKGIQLRTPEVELVNVTGEQEVTIEIFVKKGRGYVQAKDHLNLNIDGIIKIDGLFSPISRVGVSSEEILVGDKATDERLILDVETYENIDAREAVLLASKILETHFSAFDGMTEKLSEYEIIKEKEKEVESINNMTIEELKLSVRSSNALRDHSIRTVGELRKMNEVELNDVKNMGKKSVTEVKEKLAKLGITLGDF